MCYCTGRESKPRCSRKHFIPGDNAWIFLNIQPFWHDCYPLSCKRSIHSPLDKWQPNPKTRPRTNIKHEKDRETLSSSNLCQTTVSIHNTRPHPAAMPGNFIFSYLDLGNKNPRACPKNPQPWIRTNGFGWMFKPVWNAGVFLGSSKWCQAFEGVFGFLGWIFRSIYPISMYQRFGYSLIYT